MDTKSLRQLLLVEGMFAAAAYLAGSFAVIFFVRVGFSYLAAVLFTVFGFLSAVVTLLLMRNVVIQRPRIWMMAGMVVIAIWYGSYVAFPPDVALIAASIAFGVYMPLFWIPFNTLYMDLTKRGDRGVATGVYYLIWPLIGVLMPVLGGASIEAMGYTAVFSVAVALLMINVVIIALVPAAKPKPVENYLNTKRIGKGLSLSFVLQGVQEGVFYASIPILSFEFAKRELGLGGLLAIFALGGALASVLLGRFTDRRGKRSLFARAGAAVAGPLIIASALMQDIIGYTVATGAAYFAIGLAWIMLLAISIDYAERDKGSAIYTREVFLNVGRSIGAILSFSIVVFLDIRVAHAVSGIFFFLIAMFSLRKT